MVQVIQEFKPKSTAERFGQAFAGAGQQVGLVPEMMQREKELEGQNKFAQQLGLDLSEIRDPAFRDAVLKDAMSNRAKMDTLGLKEGQKLTKFDQIRMQEGAKQYEEIQKDLPRFKDDLAALDNLDDLIEDVSGIVGTAISPFSQSGGELDAKGTTAISAVIKLFNPSGPLAQRKLEQILKSHAPSKWDKKERAHGKVQALRDFTKASYNRALRYASLLDQYQGLIPSEVLAEEEAKAMAEMEAIQAAHKGGVSSQQKTPEPEKKKRPLDSF